MSEQTNDDAPADELAVKVEADGLDALEEQLERLIQKTERAAEAVDEATEAIEDFNRVREELELDDSD